MLYQGAFKRVPSVGAISIRLRRPQPAACLKDAIRQDPNAEEVVQKCGAIVASIRKSTADTEEVLNVAGLHLESHNATTWNSQLRMMRKLVTNFSSHSGFTETLHACKKAKLSKYDLMLATDLIELLSPVEEATELLQKRHDTAGLLLPALRNIEVCLAETLSKGTLICKEAAKGLQRSLEKRFASTWSDSIFLMGALLDPRFKSSWCSAPTAEQIRSAVLGRGPLLLGQDSASTVANADSEAGPSRLMFKNIRQNDNAHQDNTPGSIAGEISLYLSEGTCADTVKPLSYWKANESRFPLLSRLARAVFTVNATSADVERVFSTASLIMTAKRNRLSSASFEQLMFVKRNT
uniref:Zinc finger BED domain-containing protein 4-like isoform n=1 Tax=Rhipicephalus zambeziensis TaxID=60191 RepID=A0A224ZC45_9ACAR